ncbi:MAG: asparagine synthase (glutamine-hydrolyzing) [Bacteroidales bacterium]|nr:asparagine synthase (glutamine-hydrolyzing) [Bacteroidales bacterium]
MCGIAGIYSFSDDTQSRVESMNRALIHRGPDNQGIWIDKNIALGHSRLSIIDTSDLAAQPMISANKRFVIAFNGEVYNFKELSDNLKKDFPEKYGKIGFKTKSDTEIVLELFSCYGPKSVTMLNGMFAYVIYDREENKLFLFRDRIGIKPLFFSILNDEVLFASELQSIMKGLKAKTLNKEAIPLYLHFGYFPEPHTILNEVKKFPAAHYAEWDGKKISFTKYWNPEDYTNTVKISFKEAVPLFHKLLEESVCGSLISDVPLGVFLSGGIDSSLVAAIASTKTTGKLKTFTVSSPDPQHDESLFAKKIAKHLNTEHFEMSGNEKAILSLAEPLLEKMDEPLADSSLFPTYIISEFSRQHVTVALGGDGGDELFMGYGTYRWAKRLNNVFVRLGAPMARLYLKNTRHAQFFNPQIYKYLKSNIFSIEQNLFPSWELDSFDTSLLKDFQANSSKTKHLSPSSAQAFFDLTHYLKDDLLVKIDRASMLNSLEIRPPLLDHKIVEAALQLPDKFKAKNGNMKIILKEILSMYVPRELFDRQKRGFSIPMQQWLKKELAYLPEKYLNNDSLRIFSVIPKEDILKTYNLYMSGKCDWFYNRVWTLTVLSHFLEQHKDIEIV